jgi:hypothetical protein
MGLVIQEKVDDYRGSSMDRPKGSLKFLEC